MCLQILPASARLFEVPERRRLVAEQEVHLVRIALLKRFHLTEVNLDLRKLLAQPLGFAAVDDVAVDVVVAMLSPPHAGGEHLKALARVSRLLRDRGLVEKLRATESADALYALLIETLPAQSAA